jgi:hypothetical protein
MGTQEGILDGSGRFLRMVLRVSITGTAAALTDRLTDGLQVDGSLYKPLANGLANM